MPGRIAPTSVRRSAAAPPAVDAQSASAGVMPMSRTATAGGAAALRRTDVGALRPGARADFALLDAPSHVHLAYRPGVPLVARVWKDGAVVAEA